MLKNFKLVYNFSKRFYSSNITRLPPKITKPTGDTLIKNKEKINNNSITKQREQGSIEIIDGNENIKKPKYVNTQLFKRAPEDRSLSQQQYFEKLCKNGRFDDALHIFNVLPDKRTTGAYEKLLQACAVGGLFKQSWSTYNSMKKDGIKPSAYIVSHLLNVCTTCKNVDEKNIEARVNLIIEEISKSNIKLTTVVYNILMKILVNVGKYEESLEIIDKMISSGIKPDIGTFTTMISAKSEIYKRDDLFHQNKRQLLKTLNTSVDSQQLDEFRSQGEQQIEEYQSILKTLKKQQIIPDRQFINALLNACKNTKFPMGVFKVWSNIQEMRFTTHINADTRTYDIFLSSCNYSNNVEKGLEVIDEIMYKDIRPDIYLVNSMFRVLSRIVNSKRDDQYDVQSYLNRILKYMERYQLLPNHESFSVLISTYSRLSQLNRVYELFLEMNNLNIKPDIYDYTGLIKGVQEDMEKVLNIFRVIVSQRVKLTPEFTNLLLNIVRKRGTSDMLDEISIGIRNLENKPFIKKDSINK